jgi:hypothetical protein
MSHFRASTPDIEAYLPAADAAREAGWDFCAKYPYDRVGRESAEQFAFEGECRKRGLNPYGVRIHGS